MTINKRKKNTRQRGHKTHGWGAKKKHRGQGHRGGRGMAGSGKRADTKKPSIWKDPNYFGKHGFISKTPRVKMNPVNIKFIEQHLGQFTDTQVKSNEISIDLEKFGYNKLLGDGRVSAKLKIKVPYASKAAIDKIKQAGGEVIGLVGSEK